MNSQTTLPVFCPECGDIHKIVPSNIQTSEKN